MTDLLQLETVEEFIRVFEGDEKKTQVCIGSSNVASENGVVTFNIVITSRLTPVDSSDVMMFRYSEVIGSARIPPEEWKVSDSKAWQEEYVKVKAEYDGLIADVNTKKHDLIMKFEGKEFQVIKGAWYI